MTRVERGRAFALLEVWASVKHHQAEESAQLMRFKPKQGPGDSSQFVKAGGVVSVSGDYRTVPTLEAIKDWSLCGFDTPVGDEDGAESVIKRTSSKVFRDRGLAPVLATAIEVDAAMPSLEAKAVCFLLHPVSGVYGGGKTPRDAAELLRKAKVFPEALKGRDGTREVLRLHGQAMEAVACLDLMDKRVSDGERAMTAQMVRAMLTLNRDHRQPYTVAKPSDLPWRPQKKHGF